MSRSHRLSDIIGQDAVVRLLRRLVEREHLPHAILFEGIPGCGRRSVCKALSAALVCEASIAGDACGQCAGCRMAAEGSHPDIVELPHDSDEESSDPAISEPAREQLKAESVRELIEVRAWETALIAKRRVFILPVMERFQRSGGVIANVLLKVLEEPPRATHFLLTAASVNALLPTIRSRVQCYRLFGLSVDDVGRVLAAGGVPEGEARRRALGSSGGHRGLWSSTAETVPIAELRRLVEGGLRSEIIADIIGKLPNSKEGGQGEARRTLRRWILALQQDLRRDLPGPKGLVAGEYIDRSSRALHDLSLNIQPRLVLEGLALG
jgi:DNA polymerase-3 subunit delta'